MTVMRSETLHTVRADWLRAQGEVAYVRMLFAGWRYLDAIAREQRFNPYHDELGRFTTADGAGGAGTGGAARRDCSDGVRLAFADPRVTAALTLFTFLSNQRQSDETPFVQFNSQLFLPGDAPSANAMRVGSMSREEVDAACPRHGVVQELTDAAAKTVSNESYNLKPAEYGTRVDTTLRDSIKALGDPNLLAERSVIKSEPANYGAKNSIRIDVFENVGDGTVCVYDIKIGKSGLGVARMQEIASNAHSLFPGTKKLLVIETRHR